MPFRFELCVVSSLISARTRQTQAQSQPPPPVLTHMSPSLLNCASRALSADVGQSSLVPIVSLGKANDIFALDSMMLACPFRLKLKQFNYNRIRARARAHECACPFPRLYKQSWELLVHHTCTAATTNARATQRSGPRALFGDSRHPAP